MNVRRADFSHYVKQKMKHPAIFIHFLKSFPVTANFLPDTAGYK
jgi:hypothetical protein